MLHSNRQQDIWQIVVYKKYIDKKRYTNNKPRREKGMYVHFGCHSKMTIQMYYWVEKACFSLVYQRPLLLNEQCILLKHERLNLRLVLIGFISFLILSHSWKWRVQTNKKHSNYVRRYNQIIYPLFWETLSNVIICLITLQ